MSYLDTQLIVEVAKAKQLRPHPFVACQWVHANICTHGVELGPEYWILPHIVPATYTPFSKLHVSRQPLWARWPRHVLESCTEHYVSDLIFLT